MILGDTPPTNADPAGQSTLDDLFRRAALRRPSEWALIDASNRRAFADGAQRFVSYAAADRMVSAIAGRLQSLGLPRDTVVALQCTNAAESVLALLGVLRAQMIAAPLPLLWRRDETVPALARIGAKAIIAGGRIGLTDLNDVAMHVAAELFSIRYVCGFGDKLTDGVIPLGELFTADRLDPLQHNTRRNDPAAHVALITWDTVANGHVPVARSHAELIAGGIAVQLESGVEPESSILATATANSFGGIALGVMPWLLTGGTLVLHQPFDAAVFAAQCADHECRTVTVPGPLLPQLHEAGVLSQKCLRNVIAVWRSPERLMTSARWSPTSVSLVDVQVFGEIGLIAARREAFGLPEPFALGAIAAPRRAPEGVTTIEIARGDAGTVALRGPMVPRYPFPPGSKPGGAPLYEAAASGWVDTGYPCRMARKPGTIELTGPPASLVSVGGYRFVQHAMQEQVGLAKKGATIAALPDAILSYRLAGTAGDRMAVQKALVTRGANALIAGAFRDRRKSRAA